MKYVIRRLLDSLSNHLKIRDAKFARNKKNLYRFQREDREFIDKMPGISMPMVIDPKMYLRVGYTDWIFEPECIYFLRDCLNRGNTFMDVGANIGYFSLFAAKRVGKTGSVFSFEPGKFAFDLLRRNKNLNRLGWLHIYNVGLGETDTIIPFNCGGPGDDVYSSLKEIRHPNASSKNFSRVNIRLFQGDSWRNSVGLDHINLLKIDVEGAEYSVLKGMRQMLEEKKISRIMLEVSEEMAEGFEYSSADLCTFLEENGYQCFKLGSYGKLMPISNKTVIGDGMIVAES